MTEQAYPDALPPQYRLHWYVLERVLGQGGFGITYLARDTNLDQPVAIKEYLPVEVATRRPDATIRSRTDDQRERYRWGLERFIREARTLARFDHPNVVRVHSIFELNNTAYMVMRFEEGENLAARLETRGTLPEAELLGIMLPILDGLELVHAAGFIHRDIKPDNVHIRTDGTPVLLDFGSARHALGKAHTVTILVAPGYAPFEQYYSDSESQGPWTDLYSLGATCYRAIAGRPPLDAIARSKGILGSTRDVLVPATVIGAGRYSGKFLTAIDHALAFAEKDRPQTVAEWRQELVGDGAPARTTRAAGERPAAKTDATVPMSKGPRAAAASGPSRPGVPDARHAAPQDAGTSRWPRARGALAWGIAGAAAAAVVIGVSLRLHRADPPAPPAPPQTTDLERKLAEEKQRDAAAAAERKRLEEERLAEATKREEELKRQREAEEARLRAKLERKRQEEEARLRAQMERERQEAEAKRLAEAERKREKVAPPAPTAAPPAPPPKPPTPAEVLASADRALARGSYADAVDLLKPLARDDANAQFKLGMLYLQGRGVGQDDAEALRLFRLAADRGHAKAQLSVGEMHATGRGVARDEAEAGRWYQKAAAQRDSDAQMKLGDMYANGRGVPQDSFQAYVWYGLAARSGSASARDPQARIASTLQPAEIEQADKLIDSLIGAAKGR
jgi:serine/threonine protein kinase/TPR repeat protein